MATSTGHVMTLANSIIGVSILAMPFCFKQCGILLATLMLLISSIMSRLACHYLLKSAILTRRRNFEFLAFHTFGPTGKLTVELSIIGFMLGTCIAFFVVCGDLGPAIIGPLLNVEEPTSIRPTILIGLAVFVVLPLGLLRNVDSLAAVCVITIVFYMCLVLKVVGEATNHMIAWDWLDKVNLWRPSGLLQCIPIFSMALSCQTQLFEVFESLPNASLDKMNSIVRSAVNICTGVYITMGLFGYIAFCTQQFSGNVMLSFSPTMTSEVMKLGFVLSVAVSFPLIIFPCRASLHSLLFRRGHTPHHELLGIGNHIPELRFQWITIAIVIVSLVTGLLTPNIELVLGLVGSTIGVMICIMFPALLFMCLTNKKNNERLLAQTLFALGFLIMILGTYANLFATEQAISKKDVPPIINLRNPKPVENIAVDLNLPLQPEKPDIKVKINDEKLKELKDVKELAALPELNKELKKESPAPVVDIRQELKDNRPPVIIKEAKLEARQEPPIPVAPVVKVVTDILPPLRKEEPKQIEVIEKKEEMINKDAIKKEDDELKETQKEEENKKQQEILAKLIKHEETQKKLIEEQKVIVQEMKKQQDERLLSKDDAGQNNGVVNDNKMVDNKRESEKMENEVAVNKKEEQNEVMPKKDKTEFDKEKGERKKQSVDETLLGDKLNNLSENKELKNKMTKKMEEGIPLPLAVKEMDNRIPENVVELKKVEIADSPVDKNNIMNEAKLMKRDILENEGDAKEERGKRDVEEVNRLDGVQNIEKVSEKTIPDFDKQDNVQIRNVDADNLTNLPGEKAHSVVKNEPEVDKDTDKTFMQILDNERKKGEDEKHCPDEVAKTEPKFTDKLKMEKQKSDIATKDEYGDKENIIVNQKQEITVENVDNNNNNNNNNRLLNPTTTESIIKAPLFLSNPDPVIINPEDVKQNLAAGNDIVKDAAKPKKRDLKSVDPEKQEQTKDRET